ncbi:hypothetical protein ACLK19_17290 [Escherichia coli]
MLLSVCMMCFVLPVIACLPGYETYRHVAPALLLLACLFQGLSVGEEYGTSATQTSEVAVAGRNVLCIIQHVMFIGGQLLALLVVVVLTTHDGRRCTQRVGMAIPFALGAVLAVVALRLRRQLDETSQQDPRALKEAGPPQRLMAQSPRTSSWFSVYRCASPFVSPCPTHMQKYLVNMAGMHANVVSGIMTAALFVFMLFNHSLARCRIRSVAVPQCYVSVRW